VVVKLSPEEWVRAKYDNLLSPIITPQRWMAIEKKGNKLNRTLKDVDIVIYDREAKPS